MAVGAQQRLQPGENLLLDVGIFDHRFDHQIGGGQIGVARGRIQQRGELDGPLRSGPRWFACCRRLLPALFDAGMERVGRRR